MLKISPATENRARRVQTHIKPGSHVEQHHRNECNINSIMRKYQKTGLIPQVDGKASYGDFTASTDFHDMQNRLLNAEREFLTLPAEIRKQFDNDPGKLLDFVNNPENDAQSVKMGLIPSPPAEVEPPAPAPVEPPAEPDAPAG